MSRMVRTEEGANVKTIEQVRKALNEIVPTQLAHFVSAPMLFLMWTLFLLWTTPAKMDPEGNGTLSALQ